jgi:hypothetical protein
MIGTPTLTGGPPDAEGEPLIVTLAPAEDPV